ncbi:type II toxin-antitoxin system Phd/YefM family antitoxin [Jiangella mangrovi]|uniref:Antitoxin (DNA-binding transcriptional repressor) of toxin-antitoxin stability system n=1 Tax=Jiangella mangrovi TaxID=1524084 RepID=A0A7W9LJL1_9ACTN|nr:type II toxin-antitoxin system Phd/YefM family antitoxin [Jiangella mangrovi]MBB5786147.1 antitoxin (DNA-binding transcriptional repressor) of toxin-antitoxin stability system [Jiangella mangrovi]
MATTKVGIREFRAGLADYIASDTPVVVTRHGQTVGFFIPAKSDLSAEVAALRTAAARLDELLEAEHVDADEIVEDFKAARRKTAR